MAALAIDGIHFLLVRNSHDIDVAVGAYAFGVD
jgi:hypothetical protein